MSLYEEVVEHFGGTQNALAKALGLKTHSGISQWNGVIPKSRAFQIEVLSDGKFKASQIVREYERVKETRP